MTDHSVEARTDALRKAFAELMACELGSFATREGAALRRANDMVRDWLGVELSKIAARYEDTIVVDGKTYKRHASGKRRYHSLCGPLEVKRDVFRLAGVHNGPTVVPLEIEAGIIEHATPSLLASTLQGFAAGPLRHYEDQMGAAYRVIPSRSTLERIAKRAGSKLRERAPQIERSVRESEVLPEQAHSISIGLDRTTMPMAELTDKPRCNRTKPYVRRAPEPIEVVYRMSYVATLAVNDANGDVLHSVRVASTAAEGSTPLMEGLLAELEHVRKQRPDLPIVVVQDGAPELWGLVDEWLTARGVEIAMRLIDRYHVDERLGEAAEILEKKPVRRARLLQRWKRTLDTRRDGMTLISGRIRQRLMAPLMRSPNWPANYFVRNYPLGKAIEGTLAYFSYNADKFAYADARSRGFPIGSGPTEGACKSVIAARFKRSGQRWLEYGASSCIRLRTMYLNRRLSPMVARIVDEESARIAT